MDLVIWARREARLQLAESLPLRWAHVRGVGRRALVASHLFDQSESEVLVGAALLHDIGYSSRLAKTRFHPLDGARYLKGAGIMDRLVNLVARHSCSVKEAGLRGLTREVAEFPDESSPLRDALWWADMTTTPHGALTTVEQRIAEIEARYGPDDLVTRAIQLAAPELVGAVERTEHRLRDAGVDYA
ncbi:HD domain-containing protein [Amycolatopsis sp. NPDC059027]|uniref:HD domain-containing protein n=1 Tax=Amycolatopsis sp. NPDC059027 TaxID=3346709 RepID=UPI00367272C2